MNIGAICSAGGATFFSAMEMSIRHSLLKKSNVKVLADRPCSALLKSKELGFETELIHFKSQKDFSRKDFIKGGWADIIMKHLLAEEAKGHIYDFIMKSSEDIEREKSSKDDMIVEELDDSNED